MERHLDLSGTWQLRWFDGQRRANRKAAERDATDAAEYLPATVPGEVHLDLMRAGILADPDEGTNVVAARWVEEAFWTYRRTFTLEAVPDGPVWLTFERLFLTAEVVLNGQKVGGHGNAFRPCRLEVSQFLRTGENVLVVHLESGLFSVADRHASGYAMHEDALLHKRSWLRAPQCQFGWDWAPRLLNVGISGDVRLEWSEAPVRVEAFVPLATVSSDLSEGSVECRLFVEATEAVPVIARFAIPELGTETTVEATLLPGENKLTAALAVPDPDLWWPVGMGDPRRYRVVASFRCGDAETTREAHIGFRHVEWNADPHPDRGSYFRLRVNGKPVFCKGGNFVPADTLFVRLDEARYRGLVQRALEANFNFLRVWGGGLYEADAFYELCDAHGILVWQEFIYACARYPMTDEAFHEEVKREAVHQIRRLSSRPSLVAWCGNNEMEVGTWFWGYDKGTVFPDYAFFHHTLPRLMAREDPTRFYQPSSPLSPGWADPTHDHEGDQHPWSLGFGDTDVRKYREMECRFPNEGGVLGPVSLPTMRRALGDAKIGSFTWQVHDNSIATWQEPSPIDLAPEFWLGKRLADMSVEEFVFWGGVVQGEGLKEYVESFRRRAFDSAAAIFWMFNDTWPAVRSWTIVDHALNKTPAFAYVRRAMAPVHVILAEVGDDVVVFGCNDTPLPVRGSLTAGVAALNGPFVGAAAAVELAPLASTELARFPASSWTDASRQLAFAFLETPDGTVRNRLLRPLWHEVAWPAPTVSVTPTEGGVRLASDVYVPAVIVGLDGPEPETFELWPGVPVDVPAGVGVWSGSFAGASVSLSRLV